MNRKIKQFVLSHSFLRESYFILFQKKINRNKIDKKIAKLSGEEQTNDKDRVDNLIVSLTTYGKRINDLKYTLYSLIVQTIQPEKIIVWLSKDEYNSELSLIPKELSVFWGYGVEFRFCEDLRSYKKLIPALLAYPEYNIVTADDDIFYKKKWLEKLWKLHLKKPNTIIAHVTWKISFTKTKNVKKYNTWKREIKKHIDSPFLMAMGCGGILYRRELLYKDVDNAALCMRLSPLADDIWFYFMAILNKTKISIVRNPYIKLKYIDIYKEYGLNDMPTLAAENVDNEKNDTQLAAVMEYYNLEGSKLYYYLKSFPVSK
jgi:hypothetical protein